jgi:hypothetical protein
MDTLNYYSLAGETSNYTEGLLLAKSEGYTHLFRYINSDLGWTFFAESYDVAYKGAVELYFAERGSKLNLTLQESEIYYSEYVDIIEIDEELANA